jgi:ubiquinone/menaquinone biosynthesis C-methylase UbiE
MAVHGQFSFEDLGLARAYQNLFVPRLFAPWAQRLLEVAALAPGQRVLDVGTGTGVVARAAACAIGRGGRVLAVDGAAPMLEVASAQPAHPEAAPIEYVLSPAAPLAASDDSFDRVLCQQALQFFPDRAAGLREMRRVLRSEGRIALAVWGTIEECPAFAALHAIACEVLPAEVADLLRVPFSGPGGDALAKELSSAGFQSVAVARHSLDVTFEGGIAQALAALQATPVAPHVAGLPDAMRVALVAAAERHLSLLGSGGSVSAPMVAHLATAGR